MSFVCQQCGECCSIMGGVLSILEDYGGYRFLLLNQYTGEKTPVTVDPDKRPLYMDEITLPAACPFLRINQEDGKGYCTVHLTRPEMCRDFGCWRLLIIDASGKRVGRVMQRRFFASDDPLVDRIWEDKIRNLDEDDDEMWDEDVIGILSREGYTVIR